MLRFKKTLFFIIMIITLIAAFSFTVSAKDYYISSKSGNDKNSGTQNRPIKSLTYLTSVLKNGDKVFFRNGDTWNEILDLKNLGEKDNGIIISNYGNTRNEKPVISNSVIMNNVKYLTIENIDIRSSQNGITLINQSNNIKFNNIDFSDITENAIEFSDNISNITVESCVFDNIGYGINTNNVSAINNISVKNCVFNKPANYAIKLNNLNGGFYTTENTYGLFENNRIFGDNKKSGGYYFENCSDLCLSSGELLNLSGPAVNFINSSKNILIENLIIHDNSDCAVQFTGYSENISLNNLLLYNNLKNSSLFSSEIFINSTVSNVILTKNIHVLNQTNNAGIQITPVGPSNIESKGVKIDSPVIILKNDYKSRFAFNKNDDLEKSIFTSAIRVAVSGGIAGFEPNTNYLYILLNNLYLNPYFYNRLIIDFNNDIVFTGEASANLTNNSPWIGGKEDDIFFNRIKQNLFWSNLIKSQIAFNSFQIKLSLEGRNEIDYIQFAPDITLECKYINDKTIKLTLGGYSFPVLKSELENILKITNIKNGKLITNYTIKRYNYNTIYITFNKSISNIYKDFSLELLPSAFIEPFENILNDYDVLGRTTDAEKNVFGYFEAQNYEKYNLTTPVTKDEINKKDKIIKIVFVIIVIFIILSLILLILYFTLFKKVKYKMFINNIVYFRKKRKK